MRSGRNGGYVNYPVGVGRMSISRAETRTEIRRRGSFIFIGSKEKTTPRVFMQQRRKDMGVM